MGSLLAPAEGFGRAFFSRFSKTDSMRFWPILVHFLCLVVALVTFNSNIIENFKNI